MKEIACLITALFLLHAPVSAQCEENVFPQNHLSNQRWGSVDICGDLAVFTTGGFARGFTGDVWARAEVHCFHDGGTPGDESDDRWVEQDLILDPNGPDTPGWNEEDLFGADAALEDDMLLIAASGYLESGNVFSYARDDQGTPDALDDKWILLEELHPIGPDGTTTAADSLSLKAGLLAVGNTGGINPDNVKSGSVTIFQRERFGTATPLDDAWIALFEVYPPNPEVIEAFGESVAIDGDYLIVGTRKNRAYVFEREASGESAGQATDRWVFRSELVSKRTTEASSFGQNVALSGDTAVVGAYRDDIAGADSGAVYVFRRSLSGEWSEEALLVPRDSRPYDNVGQAIDIDGNTIVFGAPGDDEREGPGDVGVPFSSGNPNGDVGAVYAFTFEPVSNLWEEQFKLGPTPRENVYFGERLAIDSDRIYCSGLGVYTGGLSWMFRRDRSLCANTHTVSVQKGGRQEFNFNVGLENAGRSYIILGSMSGTTPGMLLPGGLSLALAPDAYFQKTKNPDERLFEGFAGQLSSHGAMCASLTVPQLSDPGLAGLTLHHVAIVGNGLNEAVFVSNPVSLHLRP